MNFKHIHLDCIVFFYFIDITVCVLLAFNLSEGQLRFVYKIAGLNKKE